MSGSTSGKNRIPSSGASCLGALVYLGALITVPMSLLVSLVYGLQAGDSNSALNATPSEAVSGVWWLAVWAATFTLISACSAIWGRILVRPTAKNLEQELVGAEAARAQTRSRKLVRSAVAVLITCAILFVPAGLAANAIDASGPHVGRLRAVFTAATPACQGVAVPGAGVYGGSSHPLVAVDVPAASGSNSEQQKVIARAAELGPLPDDIGMVQLVTCIGDRATTVVETCHYSGNGIDTRYRYSRSVSIHEAESGQLVGERTITGSDPSECPQELINTTSASEYGGDVGADEAISGPTSSPGRAAVLRRAWSRSTSQMRL